MVWNLVVLALDAGEGITTAVSAGILLCDVGKKRVYSSFLNQGVGEDDCLLVVSLHINPG